MIRIEVEVETNDPALRDYILGDVESWRRTLATVSVSTREEDPWTGGTETVNFSSSMSSFGVGLVEASTDEVEQPASGRAAPPQFTTIEAARAMVGFPVFAISSLTRNLSPHVIVQPGGADEPESVVVTHVVSDDRGRQRGNVWVTSSAVLLPSSRFEAWRSVAGHDVCEDRSGGYYRCKVRSQPSPTSHVKVESTAHRSLDEVLGLLALLRAE